MKIAIVGYGVEGQAAYEYWREGNEITICDQNSDLVVPDGAHAQLGVAYLRNLERFDLIVRSPGIKPQVLTGNNPQIAEKITTNLNEFLRVCPTRNVIGITGTKGKGTTSTLVAKMLSAAGFRVHLGGNIGVAPLALLKETVQAEDWVVLELSNFQLIDVRYSPHIAACLMVMPEHLDWHIDADEYYAAKTQLFRYQIPEDIAIYYGSNENSKRIATSGAARALPYCAEPGAVVQKNDITIDGHFICHVDELKLLGKHNWQNVCAAVTVVWQVAHNIDALRSVLTSFSGLEHRLEFVREVDGVRYYDDSFGTTPETAIVALRAFTEPKVIILGGSDKGANYDELARAVKESNMRRAVLIGEQATPIQAALDAVGFKAYQPGGDTMPEIVAAAQAVAQAGDVVLLSTGCASFDLFKNYKDRGNQFRAAVSAL